MGLKQFLERAGLMKREESGIDSAFQFHGVVVYQKPKADAKLKPEIKGFRFHGEEAYTPSPVPKVTSTPAGAIDPAKAEQEPTGQAQVDAMLLEDPAISGRAVWNAIKSLQIPIVDEKAALAGEAPSVDEQIEAMLLETPEISGVSLVSAMKSCGLTFSKPEVKEADSASANAGVMRSESSRYVIKGARFLEASSSDNGIGPTKFKVALIQEGLGNLRDAFYYTRESLEAAVAGGAFEGKKCYADHPSAFEEQDRPERSVRDIIGHFENVHIEEADDGSARLCADLIMFPTPAFEWARTLVSQAIQFSKKYPDRELVGLSINASGDAEPVAIADFMKNEKLPESAKPKLLKAQEMGVEQVRVVSRITEAVSTDLVTEPGCRGKILEFIENEERMSKKSAEESGTSDGAKKGWETRKAGGQAKPEKPKSEYRKKLELIKSKTGDSLISTHARADQLVKMGLAKNHDDALDQFVTWTKNDKSPKKKKENEMKKEEEKKESMVAADEAEKAEAKKEAVDPETDPEHPDVAKDKELILSMIKKYMGKGEEEEVEEGEMEAAHEAYEAYREMGEGEDEAMKCAAKAMKLAKHMAEKRMSASEGEKKEEEKCETEEAKHSEVVPMSPTADPEKGDAKKESEIKLVAQIAMLERQVKTYELASILDKKLKESGLGRAETDKIRECIGTPKSESHIVDTIKIFKEAFSVRGSESVAKDASFFVTMERSEGGKVEGKVDFAKF